MDLIRRIMEESYLISKPLIFYLTRKDPEVAHEKIIQSANFLNKIGLDKFLFEHSDNQIYSKLKIANGAGFNKNGDIPPMFLKYLGFDRVVVGTVTHDDWKGKPRPRIRRYPDTESLVNWQGLPGKGSKVVAETLFNYREQDIPLTINLMSTPEKEGNNLLIDLQETVIDTRRIPNIDRYQLNISCPNTNTQEGKIDARREYFKQMPYMIDAVRELILPNQELEVKFSPDMSNDEIFYALTVLMDKKIKRVVISNTTTHHNPKHIPASPGKGGASGNAVSWPSLFTQRRFNNRIKRDDLEIKITACGGINSPEILKDRINEGADEIEIYTPLIFKGPKLIRELRKSFE